MRYIIPMHIVKKKSLHKDINTKVKSARIPKVVSMYFDFFQLLVVV